MSCHVDKVSWLWPCLKGQCSQPGQHSSVYINVENIPSFKKIQAFLKCDPTDSDLDLVWKAQMWQKGTSLNFFWKYSIKLKVKERSSLNLTELLMWRRFLQFQKNPSIPSSIINHMNISWTWPSVYNKTFLIIYKFFTFSQLNELPSPLIYLETWKLKENPQTFQVGWKTCLVDIVWTNLVSRCPRPPWLVAVFSTVTCLKLEINKYKFADF